MGNNIRQLREQKELTQGELGKIFGLSKTAISLYENGKRGIDSDLAKAMAKYFGVTTDTLLYDPEERAPSIQFHEMPGAYEAYDFSNPSDIDRMTHDLKSALQIAMDKGLMTEERAKEWLTSFQTQLNLALDNKK